jgi:hypothetical protein
MASSVYPKGGCQPFRDSPCFRDDLVVLGEVVIVLLSCSGAWLTRDFVSVYTEKC